MGRRTAVKDLDNRVRELRQAAGLSQGELARRVGVTRQAISAIEVGQYVPNTAVALRLGQALGCAVDDLFRLRDISLKIHARLASNRDDEAISPAPSDPADAGSERVQLARVGASVIARPLRGPDTFSAADGVVTSPVGAGDDVEVTLLVDPDTVDNSVVVLGCDPSLGMLGQHVQRRAAGCRVDQPLQLIDVGHVIRDLHDTRYTDLHAEPPCWQ
jgi:putative molybdopterin biosynthesis protein